MSLQQALEGDSAVVAEDFSSVSQCTRGSDSSAGRQKLHHLSRAETRPDRFSAGAGLGTAGDDLTGSLEQTGLLACGTAPVKTAHEAAAKSRSVALAQAGGGCAARRAGDGIIARAIPGLTAVWTTRPRFEPDLFGSPWCWEPSAWPWHARAIWSSAWICWPFEGCRR